MDARATRLAAAALLRRRSEVGAADVAGALGGADVSELRRFVLEKLRADDLEESETAALVLVGRAAGVPRLRRDLEAIARDERRPEIARRVAGAILAASA